MDAMIRNFTTQGTEDVFNGVDSKAARKACPQQLWDVALRKLDQIDAADRLSDLGIPPANRLERLAGKRAGQHSIRINAQYRVCFRWEGTDAFDVEIVDYH
jgi:toxin HigB-1